MLASLTPRADILEVISNLSSDEVFTPPPVANAVLDLLPEEVWSDPSLRWLDPGTKTGVFLREAARRLMEGLEGEIPDEAKRREHILNNMLFGAAITELTALMARRSLYCSKEADSENSMAQMNSSDGNIFFDRVEHSFNKSGRCTECGGSKGELERSDERENYAYAFIHEDGRNKMSEVMPMQFDVIVGNPPYQLSDSGHGASAMPIYQYFVETAKSLEPRFMTMIIPSRWFAGGRGLEKFRQEMLNDDRIRVLVDYIDGRDCFPGVDVAGGVCYFLWERDSSGPCNVTSHTKVGAPSTSTRPLVEPGTDVFVRFNEGLEILKNVMKAEGAGGSGQLSLPASRQFNQQVSTQKPFGLRTFFRGKKKKTSTHDVGVLQSRGVGWAKRDEIPEGKDLIDKWKAFTSKSSSEHAGQTDKDGRRRVLSLSGVLPPGTAVTETYVLLGTFDTESEARNCLSYATTKFFRFLIVLRSSGQDISRSAYGFIPSQDFKKSWTDEELYAKYELSAREVEQIEGMIRPMEVSSDPLI